MNSRYLRNYRFTPRCLNVAVPPPEPYLFAGIETTHQVKYQNPDERCGRERIKMFAQTLNMRPGGHNLDSTVRGIVDSSLRQCYLSSRELSVSAVYLMICAELARQTALKVVDNHTGLQLPSPRAVKPRSRGIQNELLNDQLSLWLGYKEHIQCRICTGKTGHPLGLRVRYAKGWMRSLLNLARRPTRKKNDRPQACIQPLPVIKKRQKPRYHQMPSVCWQSQIEAHTAPLEISKVDAKGTSTKQKTCLQVVVNVQTKAIIFYRFFGPAGHREKGSLLNWIQVATLMP